MSNDGLENVPVITARWKTCPTVVSRLFQIGMPRQPVLIEPKEFAVFLHFQSPHPDCSFHIFADAVHEDFGAVLGVVQDFRHSVALDDGVNVGGAVGFQGDVDGAGVAEPLGRAISDSCNLLYI